MHQLRIRAIVVSGSHGVNAAEIDLRASSCYPLMLYEGKQRALEESPRRPDSQRSRRRDRRIRERDGSEAAEPDRGPRIRGDAPAARRVWPALRQRPPPRRPEEPDPRLPRRRADQGAGYGLGRARHAAHQDPVGRRQRRADRGAGRPGGGVLRRHQPHHHAPGRAAPLHPHGGHARPDAAPGRGRHHHPRGVRQLGAQRDHLPGGRRVPYAGVRRHPVRAR